MLRDSAVDRKQAWLFPVGNSWPIDRNVAAETFSLPLGKEALRKADADLGGKYQIDLPVSSAGISILPAEDSAENGQIFARFLENHGGAVT